MNKRVHAFVLGRVQGVFFRANTKKEAERLKITGWVRNLEDGRVEFLAEGKEDDLVKLIDWSKKGPAWAKVENVKVEWGDYKGEFDSFRIKS